MVKIETFGYKDFASGRRVTSLCLCNKCGNEYIADRTDVRKGKSGRNCKKCARKANMRLLIAQGLNIHRTYSCINDRQVNYNKRRRDKYSEFRRLNPLAKRIGWAKGKKFTPRHCQNKALAQIGPKNHRWNQNRQAVMVRRKLRKSAKDFVRRCLTTKKNFRRTFDLLGYNYDQFKLHIESTWESWMNWDNYGIYRKNIPKRTWTIDHIKPISQFALEGIFDVKIINSFSNLKAMDARANILKSNKI